MSLVLSDPDLLRQRAYIAGEWRDADARCEVRNPANGELLGTVPDMGVAETRRAIDTAQAALVEAVANPDVAVEVDAARGSSPPSQLRDDVLHAARDAFGAVYAGAEVRPSMSSGGSDGRYFRAAGIPTYGLSPMADIRPVDDRAHGIDERLRIDSFDKALPFWEAFLRELAAAPAGTAEPAATRRSQ